MAAKSWSFGFWKTSPTRWWSSSGGELADGPPADHDLPRAGLQEADEEVDQRGLPRAVRAQDGDELPLLDVEVDPGERLGAVVVGVMGPRDRDRLHPPTPHSRRRAAAMRIEGKGQDQPVPPADGRERPEGHRPPVAAQPHRVVGPLGLFEGMDDRRPGERREGAQGAAPRRVAQAESLGGGDVRHAVHQDEDVAVHEDGDLQPVPGDPEPAERLEDPVGRRHDAQEKDHRDGAEDPGAEERPLAEPLRLCRQLPPGEGEGVERRRPRDEGLEHDQDRHDRKRRGEAGGDELRRDPEGGDGAEAEAEDAEAAGRPAPR